MRIRNFLVIGYLGIVMLGTTSVVYAQQDFVGSAGSLDSATVREPIVKPQVSFSMEGLRDPMLSPDDMLLIKHREQQRMAAEAAERRRQAEAEKKRLAEEERRRQWELALIKDPTIVVRNQIHISGLIDKEVLIDGKLYTIGHTYKGAKIIAVGSDSVTFVYKGHRFVKKIAI